MIVPEFKLKQTDNFIQVFIRVPYIKVAACEFYIEPNSFKFYLKPYLLTLSFQQRLKQVQQPAKATYYHEKYILQVHLQKENSGQFFNNLDLISSIVNKKKEKKSNKVLVEVIGDHKDKMEIIEGGQTVNNSYQYGFSLNYSKVLDNLDEQTSQLFSFDPKVTAYDQRYQLSRSIIANHFDEGSYLYDKYENEQISEVMINKEFVKYIDQLYTRSEGVQISPQEFKLKMKRTNNDLLISKRAKINAYTQIATIMFSYLYELVCMFGQFGPQSAKTINKTSLILNCNSLYYQQTLKQIIIDCYRRSLTYSLYKNLKVCQHVRIYLSKYLTIKYIKVIIQDLKKLFDKNQPRYLLNKLYIDDYLLYIYSVCQETQLIKIAEQISSMTITQQDLGLNIQCDEDSNEQKVERQQLEQKKLIEQMQKLQTLD